VYLKVLCSLQELSKLEATHVTLEVPSSKVGEASTLRAPSGCADAEKTGEVAFTSANLEV